MEAVFDSRSQAEQAITALRQLGVTDDQVSVIAQHGDDASVSGGGSVADDGGDAGERVGKGALAGAGVGALFGLAAAAIPGVGPFITAGRLASVLGSAGGAAAAGAIVGAITGVAAGLFAKAGYDEEHANYYGSAVERGGVFVAVVYLPPKLRHTSGEAGDYMERRNGLRRKAQPGFHLPPLLPGVANDGCSTNQAGF